MFQAKKWSWKRVAANLLLVPVLAGGSVAFVQAQLGRGGNSSPAMPTTASSKPSPAAAAGDPKQLLKEGRKALAEGRFGDAQDLAQRAESSNPSGKWGLFDDTPTALRKDIQAATAKANKAKAKELVKQAKALAAQRAAGDAEKAYNLDTAIGMARKAEKLHGPYTAWDWGDHADALVKELQAERAKLKVASARPNPAQTTGNRNASGPNGMPTSAGNRLAGNQPNRQPNALPNTQPANAQANMMPQAPPSRGGAQQASADPRKAAAVKLLADGRVLADQGNFIGARNKFVEADKLQAPFAPGEFSPSLALQDLNVRGSGAIDRLVRDARGFSARNDHARADAALTTATQIAATLGLFPGAIVEAKSALHVASGGKYGTPSPSGIVAAGGPERLVPAAPVGATAPTVPAGTQTVYSGEKPGTSGDGGMGRELFQQAQYEYKRGEFETAKRLAIQAHNQGMQKEAAQLLNSIDAEVLARKQRGADAALKNAKAGFNNKEYQHTLSVLNLIDPNLLPDDSKRIREEMIASCRTELAKSEKGNGLLAAAGSQQPEAAPLPPGGPPSADPAPGNPPGRARVNPDHPAAHADTIRSVTFQKFRSEGLKAQSDAQAAFGRGETDLALQILVDYSNRVRASGLDSGTVARLLRPVEARLDTFRMMKGQTDAIARQNKEKRDAKEIITTRGVVEEERRGEVAVLVRKCNELVKRNDYAQAERVAMQAKQLDPDDPAVTALVEMTKMAGRVKAAEKAKSDREKFFLGGLNEAEELGPLVTNDDPLVVKLERMRIAQGRGSLDSSYLKSRTPTEYEIELKLEKPISVEFSQTPLDQVIENLKELTKLPLVLDDRAMRDEGISSVQLITVKPGTSVAAKNILAFALEQAGLSYVVEHDLVKITTTKKAKGRMVTKVFSVADLVTPIPNFELPDFANFDKMLNVTPLNSGRLVMSGLTPGVGGSAPYTPPGGLGGGQNASNPLPGQLATSPGIQNRALPGAPGGRLETSPLAGSSNVTSANNSKHEQLIRLITTMIRPYSWDGHGGAGKIEFYDIGSALVVNQTADVVTEVQDLLEALRRLQDLAVAVEVRIVSLAESFFERMGVDFSVNIETHNTSFEPNLTTGNFRPAPYLNDLNGYKGITVGLTPAGSFTPDLNVPVRATSFQRAIPGFGNYPNSPGNNGGISLGLAFLNDIQVYTFMELAQGDQRSNIMQAPKLTLFNGQTATLLSNRQDFYVTNVQVVSVNGQIVFIPQNVPLPGPETNVSITVQAVVSADRRFVRLNLPVTLSANEGASVPLFPITTFVTPVFEGGSQGQPIPFTQFLQQPGFVTLSVQTTVVCPDGGTVLLGGLKILRESRNEFGPPFLSKIPYVNRLFKNVGVGRDTRHIMIMVTPRIIINSEEEIFQTEGRLPGQGAGAP